MTYDEFLTWVSYRAKHGSFNLGRRIDLAAATVSLITAQVNGAKEVKFEDFLPKYQPSSEYASDEDIIAAFLPARK